MSRRVIELKVSVAVTDDDERDAIADALLELADDIRRTGLPSQPRLSDDPPMRTDVSRQMVH